MILFRQESLPCPFSLKAKIRKPTIITINKGTMVEIATSDADEDEDEGAQVAFESKQKIKV